MTAPTTLQTRPLNDANRLGLDYRREAARFRYRGPIWDVHTHINTRHTAELYFEVADLYGIEHTFSMTQLEHVDEIREAFGDRIEFIAVPNYLAKDEPETFTTDWLRRIKAFRAKGSRVIKFWSAPRGRDMASDALLLDSPIRREGMRLAYELGYRVFMTHVGDPDTWFQTRYRDATKYGTKRQQFEPLERLLDEYADVTWIGAHMGGWPENLGFIQEMLDRHPNYVLDTSATKWMVRELSRRPDEFRAFCQRNAGRVLFGSDIVAADDNREFDVYASRYWALRTLMETDYDGPSPIVDPDLPMLDPSLPKTATAHLRGAAMSGDVLEQVYVGAAKRVFERREETSTRG